MHNINRVENLKRRAGMALVLVLGLLVLVVMLVVAFLSSVTTELQSAKSYASGAEARTLADRAVNIVISQIQDATSTPSLAWASQPGMIRTYDANGDAAVAFKLYSSDRLRVGGAFDAAASLNTEVPEDWVSHPNLFSDLNQPVVANGIKHYPILTPAAVADSVSGAQALDGSDAPIEGCYLDTSNLAAKTDANQTNPVPMPVRWLYLLKDGTIAATDSTTGKITGGASDSNPVIGRVAFWTDDETCKVNVNTASEGTFWDRPWTDGAKTGTYPNETSTSYERNLNFMSPVQNEFSRYPGHPAMTCLSVVFPRIPDEDKVDYDARLFGILPRIVAGGSESGTKNVTGQSTPLIPDNDRLFASVDEFLFNTKDSPDGLRQVNPKSPSEPFSESDVEKARFFLTTKSRAPEVNLFNKPRITLWPLQANTSDVFKPKEATERNAKDRLIGFCSTIGEVPYYFQRYNTYDPAKARVAGAPYGPSQSPIPSSQSPSMDWTNIPRNQELYRYLQLLTSTPIPGLGGALAGSGGKYSLPVRDQILTQMLDYVRSGVNTYRTKPSTVENQDPPYYSYVPFGMNSQAVASEWVTGQSQVVPLVIQPPGATYKTKGFGRFSTVTQASLIFYRTDKLSYVPNPAAANSPINPVPDPEDYTIPGKNTVLDITPGGTLEIPPFAAFIYGKDPSPLTTPLPEPSMRVILLLQTFNPTPGLPPWSPNVRYRVLGLDSLSVKMGETTVPLKFPGSAANLVNAKEGYYDTTALAGMEACTRYWSTKAKKLGAAVTGSATEEQYYPFVSQEVKLTEGTFDIVGGEIAIEIYSGYSVPNNVNTSDLVQTIRISIPSSDTGGTGLPIPNIWYSASYNTAKDQTEGRSDNRYADFDVRLAEPGLMGTGHNPLPYIRATYGSPYRGDTVRSVQTRYGFSNGGPGGDYRLIAGLADVPSSFFSGQGVADPSTDGLTYHDTDVKSKSLHSLRVYGTMGVEQTGKANGFLANANNTTGYTYLSPKKHARLVDSVNYLDRLASGGTRPSRAPLAPQGLKGAYMDESRRLLGDWDTGIGVQIDGPYINKADEGNANMHSTKSGGWYASGANTESGTIAESGASFSPNRQISSAVAFGSLPSGVDPQTPQNSIPWRTLLFGRHPAAGSIHPGFGSPTSGPPYKQPPDHAFLDFFTMPIVEPYAISDSFSTAGKVNMNYQIVPFTYLTRSTAIRAVLKSTNIMAIPTTDGEIYKYGNKVDIPVVPPPDYRYTLNPDENTGTLKGFENRFNSGDIFRSASEICDISLVPAERVDGASVAGTPTYDAMDTWWGDYLLTGDNVREGPYGHLYPRLTTKSNTYTVHVTAQSLKKARTQPADQFKEGIDQVTGEFRGSFIIERTLDPNSDTLVKTDGKTPAHELDADAMVGPYKYRIISSKRFAP